MGFDQPAPLGRGETGGRSALPMWIEFMAVALKGMPESSHKPPNGMVTVRIDATTGLLSGSGQPGASFETFRAENVPSQSSDSLTAGVPGADGRIDDQLF